MYDHGRFFFLFAVYRGLGVRVGVMVGRCSVLLMCPFSIRLSDRPLPRLRRTRFDVAHRNQPCNA